MIRQSNGARDGSQAGERSELGDFGDQSGLAIIGQEMVPATANPAEFFDAPSSRTPLAPPLHRPSASDVLANGENGGEGQLVVSSQVLSLAIHTPETPQSAPVGQPQSFGPVPGQLTNESSQEPGNQAIRTDSNPLPLFDDQQLRRFAEIYSQAPLVFPAVPHVRRPDFLEQDGRRVGSQPAVSAVGSANHPMVDINSGNVAFNQMAREILALRQAQEAVTKENLELRAKLIQAGTQPRSEGEEFNTPGRVSGEAKERQEDARIAGEQLLGGLADRDLSDWLVLIEPIMADLTSTSGEWWNQLIRECQEWYADHLQLQPLDRVADDPIPSKELTVGKWLRLERRASTLLLMAIPGEQREELISAKRLTAMKIICHMMVLYQPGGLAEKELILRQLESPPEAANLSEALQGPRKWGRWRTRATDLGVQGPDPFLLLKGLNRLTRKSLEQHRDLSFRISLARSTLQVDSTPTSRTITSFALHLIAEFSARAPTTRRRSNLTPRQRHFVQQNLDLQERDL